jgi:hypothetical protein
LLTPALSTTTLLSALSGLRLLLAGLLTGLLIALSALLTTLAALLAGLVLLVHSSSSMWLVL